MHSSHKSLIHDGYCQISVGNSLSKTIGSLFTGGMKL